MKLFIFLLSSACMAHGGAAISQEIDVEENTAQNEIVKVSNETNEVIVEPIALREQVAEQSTNTDSPPEVFLEDEYDPLALIEPTYIIPVKKFTEDELSNIPMPVVEFTATEEDIKDFDKNYYFHREGVDFDTAFADIKECDDLAVGVTRYGGTVYYGSTLAGGIGAVIGTAIVQGIFGSAERKKTKRISMRNCMAFKGYNRYGLSKDLMKGFDYMDKYKKDKSITLLEATEDEAILYSSARVASGPTPKSEMIAK